MRRLESAAVPLVGLGLFLACCAVWGLEWLADRGRRAALAAARGLGRCWGPLSVAFGDAAIAARRAHYDRETRRRSAARQSAVDEARAIAALPAEGGD